MLGPEFGDELGLIRTQELLAARRLDGGQQFFTRAIDFGFSKDYRDTLRIWDEQAVLSDVVRVIRNFQRRDHHTVLSRGEPDAWASHGLGGLGRRGIQAGRRSDGVSRSIERFNAVAAQGVLINGGGPGLRGRGRNQRRRENG